MLEVYKSVMVDRDFSHPSGESIRYSTGQPMGLYSSFVGFAYTHHVIVYHCARLAGYRNFDQYSIIGDDVVIWNFKVAQMYRQFLSDAGIPVNQKKSITSTGPSLDQFEFAKRLF